MTLFRPCEDVGAGTSKPGARYSSAYFYFANIPDAEHLGLGDVYAQGLEITSLPPAGASLVCLRSSS